MSFTINIIFDACPRTSAPTEDRSASLEQPPPFTAEERRAFFEEQLRELAMELKELRQRPWWQR